MAHNMIPKANYFLLGLGIGSLIGVLYALKSGEKTREYIAMKTKEGNELARKKVQELRDRVEDTVERQRNHCADPRTDRHGNRRGPRDLPSREVEGAHRLIGKMGFRKFELWANWQAGQEERRPFFAGK